MKSIAVTTFEGVGPVSVMTLKSHGAATVDVMAVRGLGILGLKDSLLREVIPVDTPLRVLLLDPDLAAAAYRAQEVGESGESFSAGIRLSLSRLREFAAAGRAVEIYLYDHVPVWRIISIDGPRGTMFVSAFTAESEFTTGAVEVAAGGVIVSVLVGHNIGDGSLA